MKRIFKNNIDMQENFTNIVVLIVLITIFIRKINFLYVENIDYEIIQRIIDINYPKGKL